MSTLKITTSSDMMKNYLQAEIISPQAKFEALQTDNGLSMLFSMGTNNVLYLTKESSGESTAGWTKTDLSSSQIKEEFSADPSAACRTFDAGQSAMDGSLNLAMTIKAASQDHLYLSLGNSNSDLSWTQSMPWKSIPFDAVENKPSSVQIVNVLFCETFENSQYIIVDILRDPASSVKDISRFYIDPSKSSGSYWVSHDIPIDVEQGNYQSIVGRSAKGKVDGVYTAGKAGNSGQLAYLPVINIYGSSAPEPIILDLPNQAIPEAIAAPRNEDQTTDLYVISGENLYYFASNNQSSKASPITLLSNSIFSGTNKLVGMYHQGVVTLWGKNGNDQVYYLSCTSDQKAVGAHWSFPLPILEGMEEISPYLNLEDGVNTLFASGDGVLEKISQSTNSGGKLWSSTQISLPTAPTSPPMSFNSYTTTIQINDENDLPLGNKEVSLTSSKRTTAYINGLYYILTNNPVNIKSNSLGMITIMEATGTISGSTYEVVTAEGKVKINPMDGPFKKLSLLGSSDGSTDKLTNAQINLGNGKTQKLISGNPSTKDLQTVSQGLANLGQSYQSIGTPSSAQSMMMVLPVSYQAHSFGEDIMVAAGDLFKWLESGVDAVISIIKDAASEVWHFIAEIGGKIYRAVLNAVDAIVDAAIWVFKAIKTAINDLIKFLEMLFEWDDIKRTKEILHNLIKAWLNNEVDGLQVVKGKFDGFIKEAETKINEMAGIKDWSPLGDHMSKPPASATSNPTKNQTSGSQHLNHHFQNNASGIILKESAPALDLLENLINDLIDAIEQEGEVFEAIFEQLKTLAKEFSSLTTAEIIKRLIGLFLDGILSSVQVVVDALLNILTDIGNAIIAILDTKIHIPVISDILNAIGIPDISFLDLFCWISGLSFTVVYKIIKQKAPFPDDDTSKFLATTKDLQLIKKAFQASIQVAPKQTMILTAVNTEGPISMPKAAQEVVFELGHSIGAIATFISAFVNALEAEELLGDNTYAIPSAVLGVVAGGSVGVANFLIPRDPIQNTIFSYLATGTTGVRIISKIMFSGVLQKRFAANTKLSFLAAGDGRATGACIDALLVFPGIICTIWHLVEFINEEKNTDLADAVVDEISNVTGYLSRISYALAVNDNDEESRNIFIGVMTIANLLTAGLQTAEVVIEGV
ncbi:hypothetical protein [Algoriphagus chordae]|uniref:Uncharacterized protein n=1 Tax=Algoriphagus chordae TaxID=237019 RepID=A0A2W7RT17_9BACT|nr:hypothetical protein [Algoriphagus chordae]PZX54005.1 hypothetical protein LV85_01343 [Algoriphagus chordae]